MRIMSTQKEENITRQERKSTRILYEKLQIISYSEDIGGQGGVRERVCDRVVKGNNTLVCEVEASYQYQNK